MSATVALVLLVLGAQPRPAPPLPAVDLTSLPPATAAAIEPLWNAARERPDEADTVGRLAVALHAWEQWDAAAASYARLHALAPTASKWWHLAGLLETARGRHGDAAPLFARAVALSSSDAVARLRLAEAQLEAGDLEASANGLRDLVTRPEVAPAAEYGLGRIAAAAGRHEEAITHFARAVEQFPDFGAAHYGMALSQRNLKRTDAARQSLERQRACMACWPATPDPLAEQVRNAREDSAARLSRGIALARQGDLAGGIAAHVQALAQEPGLAQAHVNLIALYGKAQRWNEAEAHYTSALLGGANAAEAHANYGEVLFAQRRFTEAAEAFRQAIAVTPHYAAAQNGLGMALESSGDRDGAMTAYRQAVADAPTFRLARFNHARLLVGAGRFPDAIAQLERIQEPQDVESARYRFALSAALVRSGHVERGRAVARDALKLARQFGQAELAATIERDLEKLR